LGLGVLGPWGWHQVTPGHFSAWLKTKEARWTKRVKAKMECALRLGTHQGWVPCGSASGPGWFILDRCKGAFQTGGDCQPGCLSRQCLIHFLSSSKSVCTQVCVYPSFPRGLAVFSATYCGHLTFDCLTAAADMVLLRWSMCHHSAVWCGETLTALGPQLRDG
jgi:hypothetical protein